MSSIALFRLAQLLGCTVHEVAELAPSELICWLAYLEAAP